MSVSLQDTIGFQYEQFCRICNSYFWEHFMPISCTNSISFYKAYFKFIILKIRITCQRIVSHFCFKTQQNPTPALISTLLSILCVAYTYCASSLTLLLQIMLVRSTGFGYELQPGRYIWWTNWDQHCEYTCSCPFQRKLLLSWCFKSAILCRETKCTEISLSGVLKLISPQSSSSLRWESSSELSNRYLHWRCKFGQID